MSKARATGIGLMERAALHWRDGPLGLRTLRETLVKIGARLSRHPRRLVFHVAEVAVPRDLFGQILSRIRLLSPVPT